MLFLLDKPDTAALEAANLLAGDAEKELLLFSDGVYLARGSGTVQLDQLGFDGLYAEAQALQARGVTPGPGVRAIEMTDIVDLVMEHGKVLSL